MDEYQKIQTAAIVEIKNKLRILNWVATFVILTLMMVIVRYLYEPINAVLSFLPDVSIAIVIILVFVLGVLNIALSQLLSQQVVKSIHEYSSKLDDILHITRDIRDEIYGDILLEKITDTSLSLTGSDSGSILMLEDDKLLFKVVKGIKSSDLLGSTIAKNTGVCGHVLKEGKPFYSNDIKNDPRFDQKVDTITGYQTKSILCVPLKTKKGIIGIIEILNKKNGKYNEKDVQMISYLADHAAISIERAQFYEDQRNYEIHLTDILLDTIDRLMPEKKGHARRVARYANVIAKAMNLKDHNRRRLYFASLLHDIGFTKIPPGNHYKKESFTLHPAIGEEMLEPINFYSDLAPFILHHHERYDGTGYPDKLKGVDIPLESRIIAIAEAFDAMVSTITYRLTVDFKDAIEELNKNAGSQFDPKLVKHFTENIKSPFE